jgi:signal transduction histidine kinase
LRLAVALTLSTVLIVGLVAIVTAALATWRADDPAAVTQTGVARVGNDVAVIIVAADPAADAAAQARRDALGWMVAALAVSVVPATAAAWFVSRRLLRRVDDAMATVDAAEVDRRRRLDEVIHELRTPLAVAGTNLELAASDPALDTETERLIDAARRANERMSRTVDDLAEHGQLSVDVSGRVDLAVLARAVATEQAGPARARAVQMVVVGASSLAVPAGDAAAVHTALGNLVGNAVRLAPGGSTISISCGSSGEWAWAAVTDEGPGVAERDHALVFERGWRGRHDRDRDRGDGQHGLGLTIARQLVEANGGLVTMQSQEFVGSTFTVWLPLSPEARDADVLAPDGVHPTVMPWWTTVDV